MTYKEYLRSPVWLALRDTAVRKAHHKCQLCNSTNTLNVHHRKYPVIFGTEPITDLVVLCRKCHSSFHDKEKQYSDAVFLKGKTSPKSECYHLWTEKNKTFSTLCNPNFIQKSAAIHARNKDDRLCKVCGYHSVNS